MACGSRMGNAAQKAQDDIQGKNIGKPSNVKKLSKSGRQDAFKEALENSGKMGIKSSDEAAMSMGSMGDSVTNRSAISGAADAKRAQMDTYNKSKVRNRVLAFYPHLD